MFARSNNNPRRLWPTMTFRLRPFSLLKQPTVGFSSAFLHRPKPGHHISHIEQIEHVKHPKKETERSQEQRTIFDPSRCSSSQSFLFLSAFLRWLRTAHQVSSRGCVTHAKRGRGEGYGHDFMYISFIMRTSCTGGMGKVYTRIALIDPLRRA